MTKTLPIINDDPWLEPYAAAIEGRHEDAARKIQELTGGSGNLDDFANAYNYYGLHRDQQGWTLREWAPHATSIYLVGTFSDWKECEPYRMQPTATGK